MTLKALIPLLSVTLCAGTSWAEPVPIVDLLRAADVRLEQLPDGGSVHIGFPSPSQVTAITRALEASGRIGELAHELEHNEALISDANLRDFGIAVLVETIGSVENGPKERLLIAPEQVDFVARHLCDEAYWWRLYPAAAYAPPDQRARMGDVLIQCIESANFDRAFRMLDVMNQLNRASLQTHADLRSLVTKEASRFDALWTRVEQFAPGSDEVRPAGRPPEIAFGSAERAIRIRAAQALFRSTHDLAGDLTWVESLHGEARTCALGGMTFSVMPMRGPRTSPFEDAGVALQRQCLDLVAQCAGNPDLAEIWTCCMYMAVNSVVHRPEYAPVVRAEAARTMATIHASFPETADKAAWYLQKAQELDPQ